MLRPMCFPLQAFIPSPNKVPGQEPRPLPPASSLDNRSSDPMPLPEAAHRVSLQPSVRMHPSCPDCWSTESSALCPKQLYRPPSRSVRMVDLLPVCFLLH